jgi:hypothetical protein
VPEALERLAFAEHCFQKALTFGAWEFGGIVVSFATAIECYLRQVVPNCPPEANTLGRIGKHMARVEGWSDLDWSRRELQTLRSGAAHAVGRRTERQHLAQAREAAHRIFRKGEELRRTGS